MDRRLNNYRAIDSNSSCSVPQIKPQKDQLKNSLMAGGPKSVKAIENVLNQPMSFTAQRDKQDKTVMKL
jgi:hypothetical protein